MARSQFFTSQYKDLSVTNAKLAGSIATSKLADGSLFVKSDGTVAFAANQSMGGNTLTNVATPSAGTDAANKNYVDTLRNSLDWKGSVRVATAAALPSNTRSSNVLTASANGSINNTGIDSVTDLALNDRILVKNEVTGANNGIFTVTALGDGSNPWTLTRATDADADEEVTGGLSVFVNEGTTNGNTQWTLTTNDAITLNTTALTFTQVGNSTSYTAGSGLILTGNEFSVDFGTTGGTACEGNDSRLSDARTPVGTSLTEAHIFVGDDTNVVASVAVSGVIAMNALGVTSFAGDVTVSGDFVIGEDLSGDVDGSETAFVVANSPVANSVAVYLNGQRQRAGGGNDYTISGSTITMASAPAAGEILTVDYIKA
jgi:hypothetical protein